MPCRSLFRKALPGKPAANADAHTAMVIAQPTEPHAVADQITGPSNVGVPGGGTVQPVAHHPWEGHRIDRDASVATSRPTKAKDEEEEETSSRDLLPKGQAVAMAEEEENPSR